MQLTNTPFLHSISEHRASIMGVAMLSVMLFHQYFTSVFPFNFFHNFGYWGVDVFLFLSGMGLVNSLKKYDVVTFYKRRFMRIVPICILCGTAKYSVFLQLGSSITSIEEVLHIGLWSIASLDLWFIHTIIILYVISPILYFLLRKRPVETLVGIILISLINSFTLLPQVGYDWLSPSGVTAWTLRRLPVFAWGMFIAIRKDFENRHLCLSVIFLIVAVSFVIILKVSDINSSLFKCISLILAFGVPALIQLIIYLLLKTPSAIISFLQLCGNHSLELYLVHEFIFYVIMIRFANSNSLLLLTAGFLLSFILAYLFKRLIDGTKKFFFKGNFIL